MVMNMNKRKRDSNVEVLRIVGMLFIICHHCVINGYGLQERLNNNMGGSYSIYLACLNSIVVIGVNIFFLISGYYSIKFTLKKLLLLVINVYVYTFILSMVSVLFKIESIDMSLIKFIAFPFFKYWFIFVYIILMIASPIINAGMENITKKCAISISLFFTIMFCLFGFINNSSILGINHGYSLMFAIYLYCIGRVMQKYGFFKFKFKFLIIIWFCSTLITALISTISILHNNCIFAWHIFSYNQIFIVIASICFVGMFIVSRKKEVNKKIMGLAKYILPIYYIHTSAVFSYYRNLPLKYLRENANYVMQLLFLIIYAVFIFGICVVIDWIINKITFKIENKFVDWIDISIHM